MTPQPALLLVDYFSLSTSHCGSPNRVLDAADALGLSDSTFIGFYGRDDSLYDSAGPFSKVYWRSDEHSNRVQGVAVHPEFAAAAQAQLSKANASMAYLRPELGRYNELTLNIGFSAIKVLVLLALTSSFLFGSMYFLQPLLVYIHVRLINKSNTFPKHYRSPLERRFWQPYSSMITRLSSLFCLITWIINWRYRSAPPIYTAMYYLSLYAGMIGFGLMVMRWCHAAQQVSENKHYTWIRYGVVAVLVVGALATIASALEPFIEHGEGYNTFRLVMNSYLLQPVVGLLSLAFCISLFHFLRQVKTLQLQKHVFRTLRKLTLVGIAVFFVIVSFFLTTWYNKLTIGQSTAWYLALMLGQTFLWAITHALVFYFLLVPVPKKNSMHASTLFVSTGHNTRPRSGDRDLSSSHQDHLDLETIGNTARWNAVKLHSGDKVESSEQLAATPTSAMHLV
jgi:hypothetical protein